jgi:hypothetical protein
LEHLGASLCRRWLCAILGKVHHWGYHGFFDVHPFPKHRQDRSFAI